MPTSVIVRAGMPSRVAALPAPALAIAQLLGKNVAGLDAELAELARTIAALHKANPVSQRLAAVPGDGRSAPSRWR
jgi:hypothetical protein